MQYVYVQAGVVSLFVGANYILLVYLFLQTFVPFTSTKANLSNIQGMALSSILALTSSPKETSPPLWGISEDIPALLPSNILVTLF